MNRNTWRSLASAFLAATLSLGIAACDDDTSSGTGDMGVSADMSANADMAMTGTPGIGQIVLADVVGTVYTTQPAPEDILYRTHALVALASMPVVTPMSDPSSDLSLTPPGGCTINRFSQTNPPPSDGDAGAITISGWNQAVIGVSAVTGTAATGDTMYPIGCSRGGPLMRYTCGFAGMANADGGGMGMTTNSVIFPLIKHKLVDHTLGTTYATFPDWPAAYGDAACIPRVCGSISGPSTSCPSTQCDVICCEQSPVAVGTSNITEAVAGGTDYPAVSKMIGNDANMDAGVQFFPQPLYLVSVTQPGSSTNLAGTDPFTGGPSLSMADHAIDTSKELIVSFSCDGTATAGSGCTGASDLAALLITTSTSTRAMFATSTATGSGECISTLPGGTVKIMANQLQALVGTQTGGSWQLALARLRLLVASAGSHTVALGGGMGVFGFTNQ